MTNQVATKPENIDIFDPKNITAGTVRQYLDNGNKASDSELAMLVTMAKHQNLNPFLKEIYFIKYGTAPAQFVVSRDAYRKRAQKDPNFNGIKAGVIVENEDGSIEKLDGAFKKKTQVLIGAWCEVQMKNLDFPIYVAVSYDEYVQMKNGQPNSMWSNKPMTMLVKVAESQALRLAFPDMSGTYSEEELPPAEQKPREVNGVIEPTQDEIADFDKQAYIEQKKAELSQVKEVKVADIQTGEIINQPAEHQQTFEGVKF